LSIRWPIVTTETLRLILGSGKGIASCVTEPLTVVVGKVVAIVWVEW
jgi:hypothetical protein